MAIDDELQKEEVVVADHNNLQKEEAIDDELQKEEVVADHNNLQKKEEGGRRQKTAKERKGGGR